MAIKGGRNLVSNLKKIAHDIEVVKPVQTIQAILTVAANISHKYAPLEYGTLVNSRRQSIKKVGDRIVGTLGYYTDYAAHLNFDPNWSPRHPSMKKGPAWNPNATNHFLEAGFRSAEAQAEIRKIILEVNKL